jgi:GntR family transcriptional repressor for pyruvate dehydrogenase complex
VDQLPGLSLHRDLLYEQIAEQIQEMIVNESLTPGDRLPSERDLAERMGISRSVIREAMRVLKVRGLIDVKSGSGTYVRRLDAGDVAAQVGLMLSMQQIPDQYRKLLEIRRTLEIDVAGLAAVRATPEDIAAMESAIQQLAAHSGDQNAFTENDLAFHAALAAATHNDLYTVLLAPIADLSLQFRRAAYENDTQASIEGALSYHQEILDRIKAQDPEGARDAMRDHLDQAERLISKAYHDIGR